jgi:carbamoyl-phosphate synthase small subunit
MDEIIDQLVLADGRSFEGTLYGAEQRISSGEIVFNTSMSGYQEIISDPSYAGQIITFTYPHIGNYGTNKLDNESNEVYARGVIVRDLSLVPSNFKSTASLDRYLTTNDLSVLSGIDTRALTKHIRSHGSQNAAFGRASYNQLLAAAKEEPATSEFNFVEFVTNESINKIGKGDLRIVAIDYGMKTSIVEQLASLAKVTVVPASTTADDILALKPDGIFLSNGPGDPSILALQIETIKKLLGKVPIFGICLGHQLLCSALGAKTYKLEFGHHGANHPVMNYQTNIVEITSQNHNFAVDEKSLKDVEVTHRNLNDQVVEGIKSKKYNAMSVQHHPEAGPGPHDAHYLFTDFKKMMENNHA